MAQQIRTTSSSWMRGVATTLKEQGLDAAMLFAEVGLSIEDLDDCDRDTKFVEVVARLALGRRSCLF